LIRHKLEDARIKDDVKIVEYDSNSVINIGDEFKVSFFRVTHSIPDSFGICIDTKEGRIIDTGDFKIDLTPVGPNFELDKLARLGTEGVDLLLSDSTNAELEGYTPSETNVRSGVEEIFDKAPGRIIVSTFSSNINRIQQVVEVAVEHKRKICILGRSMETVVGIAREYGYIKIPDTSLISDEDVRGYKAGESAFFAPEAKAKRWPRFRGSPMAITRTFTSSRATRSSSLEPDSRQRRFDRPLGQQLVKQGADVKQNSLGFLASLVGPPFAPRAPLDAPARQSEVLHARPRRIPNAQAPWASRRILGHPPDHIFICDNGDTLTLKNHQVTRGGHVPAEDVYIDGNDLDGLSSAVINDRDQLKSDGMVAVLVTINSRTNTMVVPPIVYARGFAAAGDSHVIRHSQMHAEEAIRNLMKSKCTFSDIKATIKNEVVFLHLPQD
jgi:ribonuclease J